MFINVDEELVAANNPGHLTVMYVSNKLAQFVPQIFS